jgi:steroid delta-isomerase-like uncharacterized protein
MVGAMLAVASSAISECLWVQCIQTKKADLHKGDIIMTMQDIARIVRDKYDAYNSHNSDPEWLNKALANVAADCEIVDIPNGQILHGPQGYQQFLLGWCTAFPDSHLDITNMFSTEDQALVEFTARGTSTGLLRTSAGEFHSTGRKLNLRFCQVFQIKNGKISRTELFYDLMSLLQQLGLIFTSEA